MLKLYQNWAYNFIKNKIKRVIIVYIFYEIVKKIKFSEFFELFYELF